MPREMEAAKAGTAPLSWIWLAGLIWLTGSTLWFALIAFRTYRFYRQLSCACPAPQHLCHQVQRLAEMIGLTRCPSVWLVPGRVSPLLWVFGGRPRLLLPAALWDRLDAEQQRTLLAHELAHLRRHDQWVRCLEIVVTGLYWWHPVVWWATREIREAEEQCCDAWVVWALPRAARAYATALVETVDFLSETRTALPVAASGIGQVHDLRRRITMIMRGTTPRALSAAGLLAVLGLGALLLPLLPTWAQQQPREERQEPREREFFQRFFAGGYQSLQSEAQRDERDDELKGERLRVERFTREVQVQQQRLQEIMEQLRKAQEDLNRKAQLRKAEEDLNRKEQETQLARRQRDLAGFAQQAPAAGSRREAPRDIEHRLTEVERKLDLLLAEIQGLRRELRRGREGPPPGGPGRGRPGAGQAVPGGPPPGDTPGTRPLPELPRNAPPPETPPTAPVPPEQDLVPAVPPPPTQVAPTPPPTPETTPPVAPPNRDPRPSRG